MAWARIFLLMVGWVALTCAAGCSLTKFPADEARLAEVAAAARPLPDSAWPVRWTQGLPRIESTVEYDLELPQEASGPHEGMVLVQQTICRPVGRGWVVDHAGLSRNGAFPIPHRLTFCSWPDAQESVAALPAGAQTDPGLPARIEAVVRSAPCTVDFVYVAPPQNREPTGLVVFCSSAVSSRYQDTFTRLLWARGWGLVVMTSLSQGGVPAARNQDKEKASVPPPMTAPTPGQLADDEFVRACVDQFVEAFQARVLANYADAYEGVVRYVRSEVATLRDKPAVLVGVSMGAIMGPTVAARMSDAISAVVLVGGGANLLGICATTDVFAEPMSLPIGPLRVRLTPELAARMESLYLERTPLDPYNTAPLLALRPTLMVHAKNDGIVLSRYGELLWERSGRPERWVGNFGHLLLIYFLPGYADEIADWMERAVEASDPPAPGPGGGSR